MADGIRKKIEKFKRDAEDARTAAEEAEAEKKAALEELDNVKLIFHTLIHSTLNIDMYYKIY